MTFAAEPDNPIPISALQHAVYCMRQTALIHIERVWAENRLTAEGRVLHDVAHEAGSRKSRGVRRARSRDYVVVYAARAGEVALDGDGDHGPFAQALVNNFKKPGVEIRKLVDLVRDDVMKATDRHQLPFHAQPVRSPFVARAPVGPRFVNFLAGRPS
jgi:hypothetical protein